MSVGTNMKNPESGWIRKYCQPANAGSFFNGVSRTNQSGWFTVGTDEQAESGNAFYATSKVPSNELSFTFFGTGLRIMAGNDEVPISEYFALSIDGGEEKFVQLFAKTPQFTVVYENLQLENKEHIVTLRTAISSGKGSFTFLYAIDYLDLETAKKPLVSLYEKESGKIFTDDFDSIHPRWIMSPASAFDISAETSFLQINHDARKDVLLLVDKPAGDIAIQVTADYQPTVENDNGGLLIYQNADNKIEFLESYSKTSSKDHIEWLAVSQGNQWDFYSKTDSNFDYADSEKLEANKIGIILKKGIENQSKPLNVDRIIVTAGNKLKLRQLFPSGTVILKDDSGAVISKSLVNQNNTGIDITLPSLEFKGTVEIFDEKNVLTAAKEATFYGGDIYNMGSPLKILMHDKELNDTDPTNLGNMIEGQKVIRMSVQNDNISAVANLKISVQQYMDKVGVSWADVSLDGINFSEEISIGTLDAQKSKEFWVKVVKDYNYMGLEPIYFNIKLAHD
ncbi:MULTISPECIES: cell adhesion protein [unclassified Bacillus (in: firmicutes)]|uniref:cell adhesion protein n=1 Tax=unclassified Bacillus (in: firmicutes) TaxID=185979 RepID=UPI0023DC7845|nr:MULTISPECIES: cell adhesion protein [unclassified Bacillus (in: firmicutes)]MDF2017576.1 cell adhesion protein [Bacillus sp. Cr_R3]MDF2030947.1 cell adhesion protein [Bacillus sp. Cr_R16]